jgi:hypothetical protein
MAEETVSNLGVKPCFAAVAEMLFVSSGILK